MRNSLLIELQLTRPLKNSSCCYQMPRVLLMVVGDALGCLVGLRNRKFFVFETVNLKKIIPEALVLLEHDSVLLCL